MAEYVLGEIVSISKGKKHSSVFSTNGSGKKRYIQIEDLRGDDNKKYTDENGIDVDTNDLIIAWDGANAGTIGFNLEGYIGSTLARLRLKKKELDPEYLGWYLRSKSDFLRKNCTGATIPHIHKGTLESLHIPKRPLSEQKQITHILSQADKARQQRKAANALTDQFLQSTFLSLFGDLISNEKGWPSRVLVDVAEVSSGVTKGRKLLGHDVQLAPYMRVANVQDGTLDLSEIKEIEIKRSELNKFLLKHGDILLTEGGDPDKLGRGAVWRNQIEGCIHQNHIFKVRADKNLFTPEFLSFQFGSAYGKRYFFRAAKQTTGIASINSTQLKAFPVLTPPLKLQQHFASIVAQTELLRQRQRAHTMELEELFQGLLQRYFG